MSCPDTSWCAERPITPPPPFLPLPPRSFVYLGTGPLLIKSTIQCLGIHLCRLQSSVHDSYCNFTHLTVSLVALFSEDLYRSPHRPRGRRDRRRHWRWLCCACRAGRASGLRLSYLPGGIADWNSARACCDADMDHCVSRTGTWSKASYTVKRKITRR